MKQIYLLSILLFSLLSSCATLKEPTYKTVNTYELVFDDVNNFWTMYDQIKQEDNEYKRRQIIRKEYLNKASWGLKTLIKTDRLNAKKYSRYLRDTAFYSSIRPEVLRIQRESEGIKLAVNKIQELYSDARFTDVYFVVGLNYHGGMVRNGTMVIEIQKNVKTAAVQSDFQIKDKLLTAFNSSEGLLPLIVHEEVHISQRNSKTNTLLSKSITEGCADFLMYLLTQQRPSFAYPIYEYGDAHEYELWEQFQADRKEDYKSIRSKWFGNFKSEVLPADLGYYMGSKICEHYYENATDKTAAIEYLLTETDHEKILIASRYNGGK